MFLPIKKKQPESQEPAKEEGIFEYGGYGEKIMLHPRKAVWVKECKRGEVIHKREATCIRQDMNGRFYWLRNGEEPPVEGDPITPSTWDGEGN